MTDGGTQAAPGWYPDPYSPSQLRYWDGVQWTEHFHQGDGKLPDLGKWLGSTFSAIGAYGIPAFGLAVGGSLVLNLVGTLLLRWVAGDIAVIDEEFVGSVSSLLVRLGVMAVAYAFLQGVVWLSINRFMQRAHLNAEPSIGEAITHAIARLPRLIGVTLLIALGIGAVMVAFVLLIAVSESVAVAILLILAMIPLALYVSVKLTFLSAAVVAAPTSTGAIKASASVSKGRFWGVLGRVLLLSIMVGVVAGGLGAALGDFGSPISQSAINDTFVTSGDDIEVRDFQFKDWLPSTGDLVPYLIISSILNAASGLVTTSGFMRLYLDSGAPSEL